MPTAFQERNSVALLSCGYQLNIPGSPLVQSLSL